MTIQHILTDIEGTTTKISFVSDILFPYFLQQLEPEWENLSQWEQFDQAISEIEEDSVARSKSEYISQIKEWVEKDVKQTGLKRLQGKVWEKGYQSGELKAHIYPEVKKAFEFWKHHGFTINIYSSGSVKAQQLLFQYTEYGDLSPLISNYFDTKIGHKREETSYQNIVKKLGVKAHSILFLSDIEEELNAAQKVGLRTALLVRDHQDLPNSEHRILRDFEPLMLEEIML